MQRPFVRAAIPRAEHHLLVKAAIEGDDDIVAEQVFHPTVDQGIKNSALAHAAHSGHAHICQFLLQCDADPLTETLFRGTYDNYFNRDSQTLPPLFYSIRLGHLLITRMFLEHGGLREEKYTGGMDPINWVNFSLDSSVELVRLLIQYEADITATDEAGRTPLHNACISRNEAAVRLLLRRDTLCTVCYEEEENQFDALCISCRELDRNVVELLLSRYREWNLPLENRAFALCLAAETLVDASQDQDELDPETNDGTLNLFLDIAMMLIEAGASVNEICQSRGETPLHTLCRSESPAHTEAVIRFLRLHGANSRIKDSYVGCLPLHCAANHGNVTAMRMLLDEEGADIHCVDNLLTTPLMHACRCTSPTSHAAVATVQFLLDRGARVVSRDTKGRTALHFNSSRHQWRDFDEREPVARLLLEYGADPNARTDDGYTPLHSLTFSRAKGSGASCARALLENGANPLARTQNGNMFAHLVAKADSPWQMSPFGLPNPALSNGFKRLEVLINLLGPKALAFPDRDGWLPLDLACLRSATLDLVYLLVRSDPTGNIVSRCRRVVSVQEVERTIDTRTSSTLKKRRRLEGLPVALDTTGTGSEQKTPMPSLKK